MGYPLSVPLAAAVVTATAAAEKKDEDDLTPATKENRSLDDLRNSWFAKQNTPCIFLSALDRTNIDKFRRDLYGMVREIHCGRYPFNNFLY